LKEESKTKRGVFMKNLRNGARNERFRYLDVVMTFFTMILVVSNVASSAKIVGFSLLNIPLAFDGGTLLFPLSYVFGDILTEIYGFRASRKVIWTGFIALGFSSLLFFVLKILPGEAEWETYAGSEAFNAILGGMSAGGIVMASLAGYLAGEFSNSILMVLIKRITGLQFLWVRTIGSTLAGEFLDSLVFYGIASLTGVFPWELFWTLVLANYVFKCAIEILMTPVTYLAVFLLRKAEKRSG
jgi:uncharacterized integral membrane protein (TIGR00697 family)